MAEQRVVVFKAVIRREVAPRSAPRVHRLTGGRTPRRLATADSRVVFKAAAAYAAIGALVVALSSWLCRDWRVAGFVAVGFACGPELWRELLELMRVHQSIVDTNREVARQRRAERQAEQEEAWFQE